VPKKSKFNSLLSNMNEQRKNKLRNTDN